MNPFFQAVDWLVGRIEEIPAVALRSGIVTGVEPLMVQLRGEDPAPMRRLGPAPMDASGMVLSVGPARVWLGAVDQPDHSQAIAVLSTDVSAHASTLGAHGGRLASIESVNLTQNNRLTALEGDTGWASLMLGTLNLSGSPRYRIRSGMVTLRGRVTFSGAWPTSFVTIGTLPATARPSELIYLRAASSGGQLFAVALLADGQLQARAVSADNAGQIELSSITPWMVG